MAGGRSGNDVDWLQQPTPYALPMDTLHPLTSLHNPG